MQAQGNAPDGEFAKRLGLSRPMWVQVRNGRKKLGVRSLALIMARFPRLTPDVLGYVQDSRNTE